MPGAAAAGLAAIAAKAHARGGVTAAMAHGFNPLGMVARVLHGRGRVWTADIDALAIRTGGGDCQSWQRLQYS